MRKEKEKMERVKMPFVHKNRADRMNPNLVFQNRTMEGIKCCGQKFKDEIVKRGIKLNVEGVVKKEDLEKAQLKFTTLKTNLAKEVSQGCKVCSKEKGKRKKGKKEKRKKGKEEKKR